MLSDDEMYERMAKGWRAGLSDGTICGNGSTLKHTANIREWLPKIIREYGISKLCDAGAGDQHWVKRIDLGCEYLGFDLIPRNESIQRIDITTQDLPKCDAILCRMVLNHLDEERIKMALERFNSSAPYLIATQFNGENLPKRSPQFTRLDLREMPYLLGEPLAAVQDGQEEWCHLALWEL